MAFPSDPIDQPGSVASTCPTKYWHRLDDGRVQCDLCPRFCKLREGQRGACYVRGCEANEIKLFSYGRSSGFCIDPVEKKPLNHFLPGTPVLSFGTAGCNLACKFCQNWDMSKSRQMDTLADAANPETLAAVARQYDCSSVAFTYNDPVIFHEYAIDTAQACREQGIKSIAVTAGYITEAPRQEFFRWMDAANIDLKSFSETFYHRLCGGHLQHVLDTLIYVKHETDTWLEVTTLLIPGENDSEKELHQLSEWVMGKLGPETPLHFSAFHPDWKMMSNPATPSSSLSRARHIAMDKGLHYVYTGNVYDTYGDSTYCPQCSERVIGRNWYQIEHWQLDDKGCCMKCHSKIAGVFAGPPGCWGQKRQPVRILSNS